MIKITQEAKNYIESILNENLGIVVELIKGGCSGMQYKFSFTKNPIENAEEIKFEKFFVYIKNSALLFVAGSTLNYKKTLTGAILIFENPNEKGKCGCGKSFSY